MLNESLPWLICSLVHKFGSSDSDSELDEADGEFIRELKAELPKGFQAKGNLFVFVDEAHLTQSGKLHEAMKQILPGAMFIGFTGTPLLRSDKETSIETLAASSTLTSLTRPLLTAWYSTFATRLAASTRN